MGLTQEDFDLLGEHLIKSGWDKKCNVCGNEAWHVVGMLELPIRDVLIQDSPGTVRDMPLAVLVCTKCKYTRQFAWLGITGVGHG